MAQQFIEYKVIFDTASGKASIASLDASIKNTTASTNQLADSADRASKSNAQLANKSGLAGAAVVEIGRTISDSNYGMMAMANNISQLGTLMMTLISTSGGVIKGFKALASAFMGPLGLIVIFQSVIAYLEKLDRDQKKVAQSANSMAKAYTNAGTEYEILLEKRKQGEIKLTDSEVKNVETRIKALKAESLVRAQIQEIQKLQAELLVVERTAAEDNLAWYEQFWIALRTGSLSMKGISPTGEFLTELTTLGQKEKQERIDALNEQIKEIADKIDTDALRKLLDGKGGKDKREKEVKINPITGQDIDEEQRRVNKLYEDLIQRVREDDFKTPLQEFAESQLKISAEADMKGLAQLNDRLQKEQQLLDDSRKKKKEISEEEKEHALLMYDAIGGGLQALGDIAGKETAAGKAFAVAGALIDTYAAIAGQLKAFSKVPVPGYAIAQAVATGLFGIAQVKKILSVQVPGGKGSGGSAGSMSPAPSPTFNIVGSSGSSQLREAVERGMEKPVKAYVTQKDINSSAELDRNTRMTASII